MANSSYQEYFFRYHRKKKRPPMEHSMAPNKKEPARLCCARLPKARLEPIPTLSIMTALMLRAVARSFVVICRFCSSVCRGCMRLKEMRRVKIPRTESHALSVHANIRHAIEAEANKRIAVGAVPSFFVSFNDKALHNPAIAAAI